MNVTLTKKPKNTVELEVEIDSGAFQRYLDRAAARLGKTVKVPGFRPGKVPLPVLREKLGDKTLLEEAAEEAAKQTYAQAVEEQQLTTVGPPKIQVLMLAADNPFRYRATAALLPSVALGELTKLNVSRKPIEVTDADVDKALEDLRSLRRTEQVSLEPAKPGDKVEIDLDIFRDGVPLEGGASKSHPIVIGEGSFIPGFEDQLIGLNAGQQKEFTLTFPAAYHQRNLAGKPAQFRVKAVSVARLIRPPLDDAFASAVGPFKSVAELRTKLRENLRSERQQREEERLESELIEALMRASTFGEIPDLLVEEEVDRMLDELEHDVEHRGMKIDDYLTSIKKTRESLKQEFTAPALKRIRGALLMRELAKQRNVTVNQQDIERERAVLKERYAEEPEARSRLDDDEVTRYLATRLTNRKVLKLLKTLALSDPPPA